MSIDASSERDEQTLEDQRSDEYSDKVAELEKYFATHLMPDYEGRQRVHNLAFEAYKDGRADAAHQTQIAQVRYALEVLIGLKNQIPLDYPLGQGFGLSNAVNNNLNLVRQQITAAIQAQQTRLDELTGETHD